MKIKLLFKNGKSKERLGAGCQLRECLEELIANFPNPDLETVVIYKDDCKTEIFRARREFKNG